MRRSVYIDTTIPSYYVDERAVLRLHIDRTRQWWDEERHLYDLYTSEFTLAELAEGDFPRKEQAIQLMRDLPRLAPMEEIEEIVEMYVAHYLVPSSDIRDGFHLAFACFYKMDYLLTWNCAHLANIRKQEHFRVINLRLGLHTPAIITPLVLLPEEFDYEVL
jgi:predicted nucleic acid-binding protein